MLNAARKSDGLSDRQSKVLGKMFAKLPRGVGRVGNSEMDLRFAMEQLPHLVPDQTYKKSKDVLKSLLVPDAEKSVVGADRQPLVFGFDSLVDLIHGSLRGDTLKINVGMSAGEQIYPMFPAYLEIGLQRLKELVEVGVKAQIRFFSTASLSPILNGGERDQVKSMQSIQRELIERYVRAFYEDLFGLVCAKDMEQDVDLMDEAEVERRIVLIRNSVGDDVLDNLESCGSNHGGEEGRKNALVYAAYHSRTDVFQDEKQSEAIVSVGGPGEALFNEVRFGVFAEGNKPNVGIVTPSGLISRTPPYLSVPNGVSVSEFVEGDSDRMRDFWDKPKANKHRLVIPGARDLLHVARCLGDSQDAKGRNSVDVNLGLERLRDFYADNQDVL